MVDGDGCEVHAIEDGGAQSRPAVGSDPQIEKQTATAKCPGLQ